MKTQMFRRGCSVLVSLTLMTTILAATAVAQAPDDPGGPPPGQDGGPGGPPPGGFGGPGRTGQGPGGPGGFPGRSPFAVGTVSAVDANAGTITITSQSGGGNGGGSSQVIKVYSDAQFVTQSEIAVADLKVGDQIQVSGVPTGITVAQFTVGSAPSGLPGIGGVRSGGFGGPRGGGNPVGGSNAGGNAGTTAPSFATASGTIKALPTKADPHLTISLGADAQLSLKIADGAKITRYTTLKIADLKSGDRIMAAGQAAADGTLTVSSVGVNLPSPSGSGWPGAPGH